jgi:oligopeptidase A
MAVMTYLDDAPIREQMWRAYNTRATVGEHDNRGLIVKILGLRKEKAVLLGFRDFADLVLDDRMAHNGAKAQSFIADLRVKSEKRFLEENAKLEPWDVGYWAEKQRAALYDFDEEALRPYFPLLSVVNGMFQIFGRILGIKVTETKMPVWDKDVKTYDVHDAKSGAHLGSFYADWYPRENKRGGAWMDSLITGDVNRGRPNLGLICGNLTPPVDGKPALLTHREAETIFHEFGHLLHHLLTRVEVRSLAGTNVPWDWVELPLPEDLFQKMKRAKTFRAANAQMRQLGFGFVDLGLHREWDGKEDVLAYARRMLQPFSVSTLPDDYAMITGFTHLFASPVAYGAGYYSYKWAEVLDADAFTRFQKEGVFSETVGYDYRDKILAKGDSEDPAELYRSFMGRDPDPGALMRRAGLA